MKRTERIPRIFAQLLFATAELRSHDSTSVVLTSERRRLPQCGMTHLFKYALYVVFVEWLRQMFSLLSSRSDVPYTKGRDVVTNGDRIFSNQIVLTKSQARRTKAD